MLGRGGARSVASLEEILSRNLNDKVPAGLRAMLGPDERALVVFSHAVGAIVATDLRVLLERTHRPTIVYAYGQLTGAVAHTGLSRYLLLTGPGLPEKVGFAESWKSVNATMVNAYQVGDARKAAAEISLLILSANQPRPATGQ